MKNVIIKLLVIDKIVFIGLLLVLFGACSDKNEEESVPTLPAGDIVPLAVGNQWVFNSYNNDGIIDATITMDIEDELSNNRFQYGWTVNYTNGNYRYSQGTSCLKYDGYYEGDFTYNLLLYKYPAKKGDEYYFGVGKLIVSSLYEVITVPAGTFKCIRYEQYWTNFDCYIWVSPGVGQIAESKTLNGPYYRRLKSYKIN